MAMTLLLTFGTLFEVSAVHVLNRRQGRARQGVRGNP
jgi:hypothetical protein